MEAVEKGCGQFLLLVLIFPLSDSPGFSRFGTCVYRAVLSAEGKQNGWAWTLGVIALIFNPLIPIHLDKESWALIDLASAIILGFSLIPLKIKRASR